MDVAVRPGPFEAIASVLDERGQMTVELAVLFPVVIIVAVIAWNALTFFGDCAAFDRAARNAIRIEAVSPAYGQGIDDDCSLVKADIEQAVGTDGLTVDVDAWGVSGGYTTYRATVEYAPSLFGLHLKSEVFGVQMPALRHSVDLTVSRYRPGMLF